MPVIIRQLFTPQGSQMQIQVVRRILQLLRKLNQETFKDRRQLFCPVIRRVLQGSSMLPRHDPGCKRKWSGERHISNKSFVFQHDPLSSAYFLLKEITEQTPALLLVIFTAAPVFRLQKGRDKRQRQQLPVRMFYGGSRFTQVVPEDLDIL